MKPAHLVGTTSNSSNCGVGGSDGFGRLAALARYTTKESWDVNGRRVPCGDAKRRGVEHALTDLFHVPIPPIIAAVVCRQDHVVKGGPQLLARHPQQHLRVGQALLHVDVVAV